MRENATDQAAAARLAEVAPVLRSLLAEPTGDADRPFSRVVLNIVTSKEARDYVASNKRLQLAFAASAACALVLAITGAVLQMRQLRAALRP